MLRISELSGRQLPFYNGSNPLALTAFSAGAKGWCTAALNLCPRPCLDLNDAIQAGDSARAESLYAQLRPLLEFIVAGGLPTTIEGGLELLGQGVGVARLLLLPLDASGRDELRRLLAVS